MDPLPLPSSLAEVESLIHALYEPAPPQTILRIQEVLQRLQKSSEGWQLAQSLLENADDKIKFFGVLTLMVKLNTESSNLTDDDAKQICQNLISWLTRALEDGSGTLVIRKICSALATYFIHFSHLWPDCLRHLVHSLDFGHSVSQEELGNPDTTRLIVENLSLAKLQAAIWFASSFVEDVGKTDMSSPKYIEVHRRLLSSAAAVDYLLARGLAPESNHESKEKIQQETIKCLQSWILYAQRVSPAPDDLIQGLRTLIDPTLNCLAIEELYEPAVELFNDILYNYSGFFTHAHYDAMASLFVSSWARERYQSLVQGDYDFDSLQFGLFMLAYGDAKVQSLIESQDDRSQKILTYLSGLLSASGYPVGEDRIFVPALEFWSTFVETMTDTMFSSNKYTTQSWLPKAEAHVMQVVAHCWRRIQYPPIEVYASWDSTERQGFADARKDVADLLQAVFTLSGTPLVTLFVDLLLHHLPSRDWAELEAAAFCLGSLSDCVSESGTSDHLLEKVFAPPFFELIGQTHRPIPVRLRQTGLSLIERYSDYFENHAEHLGSALNLLFNAVSDPILGASSSKSILSLCSSCRSQLTKEVRTFLGHYSSIYNDQPIDAAAEERIICAISSVLQAIPDVHERMHAFHELLSFVKADVEHSLQLKSRPELLDLSKSMYRRGMDPSLTEGEQSVDDISLGLSLRALRALSNMAKGMQAYSEEPIDLDAPVTSVLASTASGQLTRTHGDILAIISRALSTFPSSGEVVEVICHIFRAGFSETEPGPFVFSPQVTADFFTAQTINSPRIGVLLSTACSFASSLFKGPVNNINDNLSRLLPWVIGLLQSLPQSENDPELAQSSIDFVHRLMTKLPEVLFNLHPTSSIEFFFLFTLKVLNGREPLPKNAAAEFWTGFMTLKSSNVATQDSISRAMEHLGPLVANSLVQNIGGNASRSELDKLSEPIKKLVTHQPHAQAWLEQALLNKEFPSTQVSAEDKKVFLKKIILLRGSRQTNQVVKDFWLACRGSSFAYAS